ncbi:MAG: glycosyltransferase [Desulfobaccales bacterium]
MKIDLHVHSRYSTRPSQWVLQKLGCQECYTEPLVLYRTAKARGMHQVTVTDHNVIDGCLELAHLPDTFISEEITTYFPEDGCKVHVLAYDLTEPDHREIQRRRENIFDLVSYLQERQIFHTLAHPFWSVNGKLTPAHFEKLLLLFENFELNGGRDHRLNDGLKLLFSLITPTDLEELAESHRLPVMARRLWPKRFTGGSDDHSSLHIGRMFTEVPGAARRAVFFQGVAQGQGLVGGQASSPLTLGHNIYSIAYQFYRQKYRLGEGVHKDLLLFFLEKYLHRPEVAAPGGTRIFQYYLERFRTWVKSAPPEENVVQLIKKEAARISCPEDNSETQWYTMVSQMAEAVLKHCHRHFRQALHQADLIKLLNVLSSQGLIYAGLAPYFAAYSSFAADRKLAAEIVEAWRERQLRNPQDHRRLQLAHFTDTFYEINGVSLTLNRQVEAARRFGKPYTIITCETGSQPSRPGVRNFVPLGVFHLPGYPEMKLFHPPVLEILRYCYDHNVTHLKAATPGPMGLTALAVGRLLKLPVWGTYHTALPQYALHITEDPTLVTWMWKYLLWFYQQLEVVLVPSAATAQELTQAGLPAEKIRLYPRGVDAGQFTPEKRNGFFERRFGLRDRVILLYVGRVSREKNLELLGQVFRELYPRHPELHLVVVGDGPYLPEMQSSLAEAPVTFTGYLEGESLAEAYASSDVFVFPSTTDTFGNVVLEAQASGLPVIVTDIGGPRENVLPGETGIVVPGNDPAGLMEAILHLARSPERRRQMGQAARNYAESRSFEQAFLSAWEMYEGLAFPERP